MLAITWVTAGAVFFADYFIKRYLSGNFAFLSIPIIKNVFHITVVFNEGAAFGFLRGKTSFLIYSGVICVFLLVLFIKKRAENGVFFALSAGLVLGGALSNLFDRITLGFVIDYLDFRIWPVFNLSDSCITAGSVLLVADSFKSGRAEK